MPTLTNAAQAARRGEFEGRRSIKVRTFDGVFAEHLRQRLHAERSIDTTWPAGPGTRYYDRPDLFAAEVLDLDLHQHQIDITNAVKRRSFTVVSSGRKIGKTMIAAIVALWWYCTRAEAQVLLTATTAQQVTRVQWRELRMLFDRAARQGVPIDGDMNRTAVGGLSSGYRVIQGFSVEKRESAAGTSGTEILYVVDEASGVDDDIFETLEGNMAAGGCKLFAISNPTQNEGWHFKAFHPTGVVKQEAPYHAVDEENDTETFSISSLDVSKKDQGKTKGIATPNYCRRQLRRHGPDSAEYIVHVLGRHAANDEGRAMSLGLVSKARERWLDTPVDKESPLVIGLDPAGDTATSDLTCFSMRRGAKIMETVPLTRGAAEVEIMAKLEDVMREYRAYPTERVYVVYDVGGDVGSRLLPKLREVEEMWRFHLIPVRSSDTAVRHLSAAKRRSAELVWNFRQWLKSGGAMPDDEFLAEECRAWEFTREAHDDDRIKVDKNEVRKRLGRSPDRFDSAALSAWDVTDLEVRRAKPQAASNPVTPNASRLDGARQRYTRGNTSTNGRGIDPFSGRARRV